MTVHRPGISTIYEEMTVQRPGLWRLWTIAEEAWGVGRRVTLGLEPEAQKLLVKVLGLLALLEALLESRRRPVPVEIKRLRARGLELGFVLMFHNRPKARKAAPRCRFWQYIPDECTIVWV